MDIVRAGMTMLLYLFIVMIAYWIISNPLNMLFNIFDNLPGANTEGVYNTVIPNLRTAFNLFIALLAATPITWFITWVMSREPDWSYRRY